MPKLYYGSPPIVLSKNMHVDLVKDKVEMCFYQYLPIKMAGALENFQIPVQLAWIRQFIQFIEFDPHTDFIYVSVKHLFVNPGNYGNRPGWHSDGFGSDDVNYIWSDSFPTQFCLQEFHLTEDHTVSLKQLEEQAKDVNVVDYGENAFVRIDRWNIHRPPVVGEGFRTFLKFSVSKNMYNLQGNSHNYLMDYNWDMVPRSAVRNHPVADTKGKVDGGYDIPLANTGAILHMRAPDMAKAPLPQASSFLDQIRKIPAERSAAPAQVGTIAYCDEEIQVRELVKKSMNVQLKMPCMHVDVFVSFKAFIQKWWELDVECIPIRHFHRPYNQWPVDEQVSVEYILRNLVLNTYGIVIADRALATTAVIKQLLATGLFARSQEFTVKLCTDADNPPVIPPQKVYSRKVHSLRYSDAVLKLDARLNALENSCKDAAS